MIEETVLAVNGTRITTETGGKIPIGNRQYEVGESVWTDGPFAFGTERNYPTPIQFMPNEVEKDTYFIIYGVWSERPVLKIYNTNTLEYTIVDIKEYSGWYFCYGNNVFAWLSLLSGVLTIKKLSIFGWETYQVEVNAANDSFDAYIDVVTGKVHWTAFGNSFSYEREYDVNDNEIFNTSGSVNFFEGIDGDITFSEDLTSQIISRVSTSWEEAKRLNTAPGESFEASDVNEPSIADVAALYPDYEIRNWVNDYTDLDEYQFVSELIRDNYNNYAVLNRPKSHFMSITFKRYDTREISVSYVIDSAIFFGTQSGEATIIKYDGYTGNVESPVVSQASIASVTLNDEFYISNGDIDTTRNYERSLQNAYESFNNISALGTHVKHARYNFQLVKDDIVTQKHVYWTKLISVAPEINEKITNDYTEIINLDNGITLECSEDYPAKQILKFGNWSMDVTALTNNYLNRAHPPVACNLYNGKILYMIQMQNTYIINKDDKTYQNLDSDTKFNIRVGVIKTNLEQLTQLLKTPYTE